MAPPPSAGLRLLQLVPPEHPPDRRPRPQAFRHRRQGQQAGGLTELPDRQDGQRVRPRTPGRPREQPGTTQEALRVLRSRGDAPDEPRARWPPSRP